MSKALATRPVKPEDLRALGEALGGEGAEAEKSFPSLAVCVCQPGAVIVSESQAGTEAYVVLKGEVSVRRSRWVFLQKEIARLKAGAIFGEINFLMPGARSASVVAAGPCEVARIAAKDLKDYLDARPQARSRIEELARQRLYAASPAG